MDEPTPSASPGKLPAYLALAPAILLAVVLGFVYGATLYLSDSVPEQTSTISIAHIEERVTELAKEIVQSAVEVIEPSGRRLFPQPQGTQNKISVKLTDPSVILDFTGPESSTILNVRSSSDMKSVFGIDLNNGSPTPVSATLSVSVTGATGKKSFARGLINFPAPVPVAEKDAFAFYMKGSGLTAVRVSAVEAAGENFILWEKRDVPVSQNWTLVTIPFADCYIWLYDRQTGRYTRSPDFSKPRGLTAFRILVQPQHLTGGVATLWIDSISLR